MGNTIIKEFCEKCDSTYNKICHRDQIVDDYDEGSRTESCQIDNIHCDQCCTTYCPTCEDHCCECHKPYLKDDNMIHCLKCHKEHHKAYCCTCKKQYQSLENHCCQCKVWTNKNKEKHCCLCAKNHRLDFCCFCSKSWNIRTQMHCCVCRDNFDKRIEHKHLNLETESTGTGTDADYDKISRISTPSVISVNNNVVFNINHKNINEKK